MGLLSGVYNGLFPTQRCFKMKTAQTNMFASIWTFSNPGEIVSAAAFSLDQIEDKLNLTITFKNKKPAMKHL